MTAPRGFVASGAQDAGEIARAAARAEALGYATFWITVHRDRTDPAAVMTAALEATSTIEVGLGLVPLDAFSATALGRSLSGAPRRAIAGLGVGRHQQGAAAFWSAGAQELRAEAPDLRIAVGSYGPQVLRAGGALADVVLLNWMTPERLRWSAAHADAGAAASGRPAPRPVHLFVSVAHDPQGAERIDGALSAFAAFEYHRRHQEAMGATGTLGVVVAEDAVPGDVRVPEYGPDVICALNPVGDVGTRERAALLELCRP